MELSEADSRGPSEGRSETHAGLAVEAAAGAFRPYRLVRLLGEGSMARVFLAVHERLGRHVALKLLNPEFAAQPEFVALFQAEARAVNRIRHRNVIKVTDLVQRPEATFMVMEYLEGHTLADELRAGPLPLRRALQIARQVASALAAAHQAGVVHRDMKPANIFIEEPGCRVKVFDFGVAKLSRQDDASSDDLLAASGDVRLSGFVVGTPAYMPPEQARGEPVSERADIYSVGVILYEMLAGQTPFEGMGAHLLGHTLFLDPRPLSQLRGAQDVPSQLEALIRRCLSRHPGQRVQQMDELRLTLEALLTPALLPTGRTGWCRGRAWLQTAALALAGLAAAGLPVCLALLQSSAAPQPTRGSLQTTLDIGTLHAGNYRTTADSVGPTAPAIPLRRVEAGAAKGSPEGAVEARTSRATRRARRTRARRGARLQDITINPFAEAARRKRPRRD